MSDETPNVHIQVHPRGCEHCARLDAENRKHRAEARALVQRHRERLTTTA